MTDSKKDVAVKPATHTAESADLSKLAGPHVAADITHPVEAAKPAESRPAEAAKPIDTPAAPAVPQNAGTTNTLQNKPNEPAPQPDAKPAFASERARPASMYLASDARTAEMMNSIESPATPLPVSQPKPKPSVPASAFPNTKPVEPDFLLDLKTPSKTDKPGDEPPMADAKPTNMSAKRHLTKLNLKELIKKHLQAGACKMEYDVSELHQLLDLAKASMQKMPTLVELSAPVNVCGDIHGQYQDLMRIFVSCGLPFKSRYLFLGDYVDRGRHSLEVIVLLLACQIKFPKNIFLLRGNHELPNINRVYGFHAELRTRYRNLNDSKALYDHFNEVFSEMPLAALVSGKILCMHGGLSPFLNSLDDIRKIKRPISVVRGLAQDLLWADPEAGIKGFQPNKVRAVSHIFGEDAVRQKTQQLKIDMVIRAHQVVEFGYAFFASRKLVTIFSAARYHEDLCNYAAVVQIDERLELTFMQLKPTEFEQQKKEKVARTMDVDDDDGNDDRQ